MKQAYIKRIATLEAHAPALGSAGQLTYAELDALSDEELDERLDEVAGAELAAVLRRLSPAEVDALIEEYR